MALFVYVDDIVLTSNNTEMCNKFKTYLNTCFTIKDLGPLKYFLGIEFAHRSQGLFLLQQKYSLEIINQCGPLGAKLFEFSMEENHKITLEYEYLLADPSSYRRLIGRLIYVAITTSDLTYAVHILY